MIDYEEFNGGYSLRGEVSMARGLTQPGGGSEGNAVSVDASQVQQAFQAFDVEVHKHPPSEDATFASLVFNIWKGFLHQYVIGLAHVTDNQLLYVWNTGQLLGPALGNPFRSASYTANFFAQVLASPSTPVQNRICLASGSYQVGYWCAGIPSPAQSPCEAWCNAAGTQQYCLYGIGGVCPCFFDTYGRVPNSRAEMDAFGNQRGLRGGDGNWSYPVGADGCGSVAPPPPPAPTDLHDGLGNFNTVCDAARSTMVTFLTGKPGFAGLGDWQNAPCSLIQTYIQDHPGIFTSNDPVRVAAQCINGVWRGSSPRALGVACGEPTPGGGPSNGVCNATADCPTGYKCVNQVCAPDTGAGPGPGGGPPPGFVGCTSDAQCSFSYKCVSGVCQFEGAGSGGACTGAGDCPPGQACVDGVCGAGGFSGILTTLGLIAGLGAAAFAIRDHLARP